METKRPIWMAYKRPIDVPPRPPGRVFWAITGFVAGIGVYAWAMHFLSK